MSATPQVRGRRPGANRQRGAPAVPARRVEGSDGQTLDLARRVGLEPDENAWRVERALLDFLESDLAVRRRAR
jgi:hypothetical protein